MKISKKSKKLQNDLNVLVAELNQEYADWAYEFFYAPEKIHTQADLQGAMNFWAHHQPLIDGEVFVSAERIIHRCCQSDRTFKFNSLKEFETEQVRLLETLINQEEYEKQEYV